MRQTTVPDSKTKAKLIEAAEGLLAEVGFDAVSVRDITSKAGTNVAAVNYHFGGREILLGLVVQRYVTAVNDERLARLDAIDREYARETPPLEELIDALVRPIFTQVCPEGLTEKRFHKLLGRVFGEQSGNFPPAVEENCKLTTARFMRLFERALPGLCREELAWRIHFLTGAISHMLTQEESLHRLTHGLSGKPTMDATLTRFVSFAVAGMQAGLERETNDPHKGIIKDSAKEPVKEARHVPQSEFLF